MRIQATGKATYPDVSVFCERIDLDPDDPQRHTAINPSVLIEVRWNLLDTEEVATRIQPRAAAKG